MANGASTVSSTWLADVRAEIGAVHGAAAADAILGRLAPHIPAGYDELNWANGARVDLPLVDRVATDPDAGPATADRKSTRLNSSH